MKTEFSVRVWCMFFQIFEFCLWHATMIAFYRCFAKMRNFRHWKHNINQNKTKIKSQKKNGINILTWEMNVTNHTMNVHICHTVLQNQRFSFQTTLTHPCLFGVCLAAVFLCRCLFWFLFLFIFYLWAFERKEYMCHFRLFQAIFQHLCNLRPRWVPSLKYSQIKKEEKN